MRSFLRTAFYLDAAAAKSRATTHVAQPAPDVETDLNPAALAIRAQRAMGAGEAVRVRLHGRVRAAAYV